MQTRFQGLNRANSIFKQGNEQKWIGEFCSQGDLYIFSGQLDYMNNINPKICAYVLFTQLSQIMSKTNLFYCWSKKQPHRAFGNWLCFQLTSIWALYGIGGSDLPSGLLMLNSILSFLVLPYMKRKHVLLAAPTNNGTSIEKNI